MKTDFINELGVMFTENNSISDDIYNKLNVKRGLRNKNGTGVLVGLTKIGSVLGYSIDKDGKKFQQTENFIIVVFLLKNSYLYLKRKKLFALKKQYFYCFLVKFLLILN